MNHTSQCKPFCRPVTVLATIITSKTVVYISRMPTYFKRLSPIRFFFVSFFDPYGLKVLEQGCDQLWLDRSWILSINGVLIAVLSRYGVARGVGVYGSGHSTGGLFTAFFTPFGVPEPISRFGKFLPKISGYQSVS